jgi:hypothetical protein
VKVTPFFDCIDSGHDGTLLSLDFVYPFLMGAMDFEEFFDELIQLHQLILDSGDGVLPVQSLLKAPFVE